MSYHSRLPAAPLRRELRRALLMHGLTFEELAVRLDISCRTLSRLMKARDIGESVADRMSCRLGLHPILLWPNEWLHGSADPHDGHNGAQASNA